MPYAILNPVAMAPCCFCKCCTGYLTCGCSTFAHFIMLLTTGGLVVIQPSYHKKNIILVHPTGMPHKISKSNCIDSNSHFIAVFAVRWVLCLGVHTCAWFLHIHSDTTSLLLVSYHGSTPVLVPLNGQNNRTRPGTGCPWMSCTQQRSSSSSSSRQKT